MSSNIDLRRSPNQSLTAATFSTPQAVNHQGFKASRYPQQYYQDAPERATVSALALNPAPKRFLAQPPNGLSEIIIRSGSVAK